MKLPLSLRASESDRVFTCHGSLLAVPLVPRSERDDGLEGSAIHYQIAKRAVEELGATAEDGLQPVDFKLPRFSQWIPQWAIDLLREKIPADWSLMVEVSFEERYELPRHVWVPVSEIEGPIPGDHEQRGNEVCIKYVVLTGHADILALSPDATEAIGVDWKSGTVGADPAESNWQAAQYTGLAKLSWPTIQKMTFILAQPRIDEEATGIKRVSDVTLEGAALDRLNSVLADEVNKALEDRYTTNSAPKACRYCPVAGPLCPSIQSEVQSKVQFNDMKATLTPAALAALKEPVTDAVLGDFVISGRILADPVKQATEMLHKRIDEKGYVDAGCGSRITRIIRKGDISIPDKTKFREAVEVILPERERQDRCISWSKSTLIDEIAEARGIHKESKKGDSAAGVYSAHLEPLTVQGERRLLVIS